MEGVSPYQGLAFFDVKDADRFFGREALTAQLVTYLKDHRFLAVVGVVGERQVVRRAGRRGDGAEAGRSSRAATNGRIVSPSQPHTRWNHWPSNWSPRASGRRWSPCLMDDMAADSRSLHLHARQTIGQAGAGDRLLLVVDQFEEVFTLCKDPSERKAFVDNLLAAATADGVTTVILTLRADLLPLRPVRQPAPGARGAPELYRRDGRERTARRHRKTRGVGRLGLRAGLVDAILADVAGKPETLPLLSEALLETWERRRGGTLTFAGYHEAGGVRGAIGPRRMASTTICQPSSRPSPATSSCA